MKSEFTWGSDFPLPVEIERSVERSVKNRYDILMAVKSDGVNLFVKSQMAWEIARSEFGFSIPMVNCFKMSRCLESKSDSELGMESWRESMSAYLDALVNAGEIGWYHVGCYNAVWGFERKKERIKSIMGDEFKSNEEKFEEQLKSLESNADDSAHDDPFLGADIEFSSSASSEAETPFDAGEPVPAEKPADPTIPHKKSFMELMKERRDMKK